MRKGYRSADARLQSFEKGLLYCKLTVAGAILKGLLHVSLGAVGKCCRGWFIKKLFIFSLPCINRKSRLFYKPKAFLAHKPCLAVLKRQAFPSSISHSHPAITYCPPKNSVVLLISALNPYAVTPELRTDSNPHPRYPERLKYPARPVT